MIAPRAQISTSSKALSEVVRRRPATTVHRHHGRGDLEEHARLTKVDIETWKHRRWRKH